MDELTTILSSDTPNTYKIPMSITELRKTDDKSGKEATVCDVAIHPQFFQKINASIVFRDFLITIIFEAFDNKYNVQINRDTWIILKNRKCIGALVKHRVQNRDVKTVYESYQNPSKEHRTLIEALDNSFEPRTKTKSRSLITEINNKETAAKLRKETPTKSSPFSSATQTRRTPVHRLLKRTPHGHSPYLLCEFYLPEIPSQNDINLSIGQNRLSLETKHSGYLLDSFFDYKIAPEKCVAQFNIDKRVS